MLTILMLSALACAPPAGVVLDPPAPAPDEEDDPAEACTLRFEPATVTVGPNAPATVEVSGCARDAFMSCSIWIMVALPAEDLVDGDVVEVTSAPGYSTAEPGACVLTHADGTARLDVELAL